MLLLCKHDNRLFRRSTRSVREVLLQRGELADDVVLLACSRATVSAAIRIYVKVAVLWGCLSVSLRRSL